MRQILRHLCKYPYRKGHYQFDWIDLKEKGIEQKIFVDYLIQKRFLEPRSETLIRLLGLRRFGFFAGTSERGIRKWEDVFSKIELVISQCRQSGYLEPAKKEFLKITPDGWSFSHGWVNFVNDYFKKYSIFTIILGSSLIGILAQFFWRQVVNFF